MTKKVLILGSGGREHALGWNLGKEKGVEVYYAPGNGGTRQDGINVSIDPTKTENFPAVLDYIEANSIDMVIVGPEDPLDKGIVDFLNIKGFNRVFGPTSAATRLESDKFYSHTIMEMLGIPQAYSVKCSSTAYALDVINRFPSEGVVIKARGLTAGKGVTVCDTKKQALEEIDKHAEAYGQEVLIAERLVGEEFSIFAISDGKHVIPLGISLQDHKPRDDNDKGPNTGGMGAYGPAPIAPLDVVNHVANRIMAPIIRRMHEVGPEYKGFLYAGMMMTADGPKVIEFNARFGDPECQPAMMMLKNSLYEPISLALEGKLDENFQFEFNPGAACCVVLASQGYPGKYEKGLQIIGLNEAAKVEGVKIFHAGTAEKDGQIVTAGGRVLGVTAYSPDGIREAQRLAYVAAELITTPGGFHRRGDIAEKAFK